MKIVRRLRENQHLLLLISGIICLTLAILFGRLLSPGAGANLLVFAFAAAGLVLCGGYIRVMLAMPAALEKGDEVRLQAEIRSEMEKKYLAENQTRESELMALQSQINPHFLYNTLDSIRGQAMLDGAVEIADMTEALSAFFRYSISRKGNLVTLRDEIWNLDNYMKIQQFRFDDKFVLKKQIDCEDEVLECCVPKMILQPLVENAIYHGLELLEEQGSVTLRIEDTGRKIRIQVEDTGVGIPEQQLREINARFKDAGYQPRQPVSKKSGIALRNVNDRIHLYFGDDYGLFVRSVVGVGTQVDITIPQEKDIRILDGKVGAEW